MTQHHVVTATCPCGKPAEVKYCTRVCAGRYGGGKRPPSTHCGGCGRAVAGDNAYPNGKHGPRCRHCTLARGRGNYQPLPRGERANAGTADTAPPAAAPQRPVWRPAGFTATPNVGRAS